jgi:pilus assembly protein CpaF
VGLGPVGPLLEDDDVSEIQCVRQDQVLALRGGQVMLADSSFTSEDALSRVIARLAGQSGDPWKAGELVVERRLPRGAQMLAIVPPAASGPVLVVRKRRRVDMSLEDFVRSSTLSRPMAVFLENCLSGRANVLVSGPSSAAMAGFMAALASSGPQGERICVLHDVDEINVAHAHIVSLPIPDSRARGEETVRAATKLRPDRLVVAPLAVHVTAAVLEAMAEGSEGVLAGVSAPSLRQALARMVSQVTMARPGLSGEAIREAIGEAFDVAVELSQFPDGRIRLVRVAELSGGDPKVGIALRDIFSMAGEGEGAFAPTGVIPRVVGDLASRGVKIDPNIFKRGR